MKLCYILGKKENPNKKENLMPDIVYKQASITIQTAKNIDLLKDKFAKDGMPLQAPAIIGLAIKDLMEKMNVSDKETKCNV